MAILSTQEAIPPQLALQLCEEVRAQNRGKWYTFNGLWCWGCATFTRGDKAKLCFASTPENRGCSQVNKLYTERCAPFRPRGRR